MKTSLLALTTLAATTACATDASAPEPTQRPGLLDSSQVYQGTPSANERAFWAAVLEASDERRAAAVEKLKADVEADPTNGYSAFLIGASSFMPPRASVEALANGTAPPKFRASPDAAPFLEAGLQHLTDPLYQGFDGMLLSGFLFAAKDPRAQTVAAEAFQRNPVASRFGQAVSAISAGNAAGALETMLAFLDYCRGAPVARDGADAGQIVEKMNAGALQHRECSSGFYGPHGSSGTLQIVGDLLAVNGHPDAARRYYAAVKQTSDFATWPLAPITERRLVDGAAAPSVPEVAAITATCGTCHVRSLP